MAGSGRVAMTIEGGALRLSVSKDGLLIHVNRRMRGAPLIAPTPNFVPNDHIVVVDRRQIALHKEEVQHLRSRAAVPGPPATPCRSTERFRPSPGVLSPY